jgi:hypothetical protein
VKSGDKIDQYKLFNLINELKVIKWKK